MKDLCISPSRAGDAGWVSLCKGARMVSDHIGHRLHRDRLGGAHPTAGIG